MLVLSVTLDELPPGPRLSPLLQTVGFWFRPTTFMERARSRYGSTFTIRLLGREEFVVITDPQDAREVLTAPPDVLHPGEGARILEPLLGPNSVIVLDEDAHLEQRRVMLPPFHGESLDAVTSLIDGFCETETASWPVGEPISLHQRLQRVTLEIILRVVFGLQQGAQFERLRETLVAALSFGENPIAILWSVPLLARHGARAQQDRRIAEVDEMLFELIAERRRDGAAGDDVLALLLAARHEDGSPMSDHELRDELMTALVAGHETTASQLAWAFTILARAPWAVRRIREDLQAGSDAYLTATIQEVMRIRPVLSTAEPRVVRKPFELAGRSYEPGTIFSVSALLLHRDAAVYEHPERFDPSRFLEQAPNTYTWIPFGGGRRRCIGASFALVEMHSLLRSAILRYDVAPAPGPRERTLRRGITFSPSRGAAVVLADAQPAQAPEFAGAVAAS